MLQLTREIDRCLVLEKVLQRYCFTKNCFDLFPTLLFVRSQSKNAISVNLTRTCAHLENKGTSYTSLDYLAQRKTADVIKPHVKNH